MLPGNMLRATRNMLPVVVNMLLVIGNKIVASLLPVC